MRNARLKDDAKTAELRAWSASSARKDVEEKARGLLFDIALRHNKLKRTIDAYKKRWPDLAEEMDRIQKEESEKLDNDNEHKNDIKRRVATNF